MRLRVTCAMLLAFACAVLADTQSDRNKVFGRWEAKQGGSNSESWVLEDVGDKVHIVHTRTDGKKEDYTCNTNGRDCEVRFVKDKATVSLYFNGPMLVEMATQGGDIGKRRFSVEGDGNTLKVEWIPIVSSDKTNTEEFQRAPTDAAKK